MAASSFISSATMDPDVARRLAKQLEATGRHYLDAPISGGAGVCPAAAGGIVKELDERPVAIYGQVTLPSRADRRKGTMETTMREEIRIGRLAIRFLLEGAMTGGSMAVFEFDVPVGTHGDVCGVVYAPHSSVLNDTHGTPQVEVWGAVVSNSAGSPPQFALHYDQSLGDLLTTGKYEIKNWREEPL